MATSTEGIEFYALSTAVCPMGFKSLEVLQTSNLPKGGCIFVELPLRSSVFCTSRRALLLTNQHVVGWQTCDFSHYS